jgi:hypothetical protein
LRSRSKAIRLAKGVEVTRESLLELYRDRSMSVPEVAQRQDRWGMWVHRREQLLRLLYRLMPHLKHEKRRRDALTAMEVLTTKKREQLLSLLHNFLPRMLSLQFYLLVY